jgi:uncharacterized membrane protein
MLSSTQQLNLIAIVATTAMIALLVVYELASSTNKKRLQRKFLPYFIILGATIVLTAIIH